MDRWTKMTTMGLRALLLLIACWAPIATLDGCSRQKSPPASQAAAAPSSSAATSKWTRPVVAGPTNPGLKLLKGDETTPEVAQRAREILDDNRNAPFGTEVPFEVDGRSYVGRIEEHYHEPGGPRKPWGRHRGITVYRAD